MFHVTNSKPAFSAGLLAVALSVFILLTEARTHQMRYPEEVLPSMFLENQDAGARGSIVEHADYEDNEDDDEEESGIIFKRTPSSHYDNYTPGSDRPRRMCGEALIRNLKQQCGKKGTYSPYEKRAAHRLKRLPRDLSKPLHATSYGVPREDHFVLQKRFDDICQVYLQYEPDSPVTQCCCLGCTRAYLENYCAEG